MSWIKGIVTLLVIAIITNTVVVLFSFIFDGFKRRDTSIKSGVVKNSLMTYAGMLIFIIWAGCAKQIILEMSMTSSFLKYVIIGGVFLIINKGLTVERIDISAHILLSNNYKNESIALLYSGIDTGTYAFLIFIFFNDLHNAILFDLPKYLVHVVSL